MKLFFISFLLLISFITSGAWAYPQDTVLLARKVQTQPDPEAEFLAPRSFLQVRIDRYGNACLIAATRVPGCGLVQAVDMEDLIQALEFSKSQIQIARSGEYSLFRPVSAYLMPLPPRPGYPRRQTGVEVNLFFPENKPLGYVMLTIHDAQVGGGGQFFLRAQETEELVSLLEAIPGTARLLDKRLTAYEKRVAEERRYAPPRQEPGLGFPFSLLPLLKFFL